MLTLWNPLSEIDRFFGEDFFPVMKRESRSWYPHVDVKEEEKQFVISAELPGVDPKDVSIELKDGVLSIRGEKKFEKEEKKDKYHRVERCYGSFSRSFVVPDNVDAEKIDAKYKDGVLTLGLPKKEEAKPKKIQIKN